jgi:hypothetical protein
VIVVIDGVTVEGSPAEVGELLAALRQTEKAKHAADVDSLTPIERRTYDIICKHPTGIHYTNLAAALQRAHPNQDGRIGASAANARCQSLEAKGFVERVRSGIYGPKDCS